jgi:hypothetical protein
MQYFEPTKPVEELYDTQSDPHEVKNLADDPRYKDILERLREVHAEWVKETGDIGLIPESDFDEMKRPGGIWQNTAAPLLVAGPLTAKAEAHIGIWSPTHGASIAYRIEGAENKTSGWKLYTKQVLLKPGQILRAKACRIGFRDSNEVKFKLGDPVVVGPPPVTAQHWRDNLDKTDLLERLRKIKKLDGIGNKAIPSYFEAMNDEYGSVRYWAVVGLHNNCKGAQDIMRARAALRRALADASPVVRIAAAHAMCDWGNEKEALPVLVEMLRHKSDTVRLNAAITLGEIGEKARPALSQLKAAMKDPYRYVQRVTEYTLKRLKNR